jgi:hypothetical protein
LLLYKQDSLVLLEKELDRIDQNETRALFLGNRRRDRNDERREVMEQIELELAEYGRKYLLPTCPWNNRRLKPIDLLVKRNQEILATESPKPRDILNLQNWLKDDGGIARDETKYLLDRDDLMALDTLLKDEGLRRLQETLEDVAWWLVKKFRRLARLVSARPQRFVRPWEKADYSSRKSAQICHEIQGYSSYLRLFWA